MKNICKFRLSQFR